MKACPSMAMLSATLPNRTKLEILVCREYGATCNRIRHCVAQLEPQGRCPAYYGEEANEEVRFEQGG